MAYKTYDTALENYFFTFLKAKTNVYNYFELPTNDCFTYCIKEIYHCQKNILSGNVNNNYILDLSKHFYDFLEKDKILKKVNSLDYAVLIEDLKEISEGKKQVTNEKYTFYRNICHRDSFLYFKQICNDLLALFNDNSEDFDLINELSLLFLNESLSRGTDSRFISKMVTFYDDGVFGSFENFLNYFLYKKDSTYDIFLPIKNAHEKDIELLNDKEQIVEQIDNTFYVKVYENKCIDYYTVINSHMTRIDSIFNLLKLYTKTSIDFDFNKDIIINTTGKYELEPIYLAFRDIITYKGISPYSKHLQSVIINLDELAEKERSNYHKLLNIIAYAEKDNDVISPSSYVDYWIALESLISLSGRKVGYAGVLEYLPCIIAPKFIINKLTFLLKKVFYKKEVKAEDFISLANNGTTDALLSTVKNPYYKYELQKFSNIFKNFKNLRAYFNHIEEFLRIDILRIYMLRNEYVHESNLTAFCSTESYKLKNYLTIAIDEFFKTLSQKSDAKYVSEFGFTFDIFTRIIEKNIQRNSLLLYLCECRKTKNKVDITIDEIGNSIGTDDVMINIVLNNVELLKKYKVPTEYKKFNPHKKD